MERLDSFNKIDSPPPSVSSPGRKDKKEKRESKINLFGVKKNEGDREFKDIDKKRISKESPDSKDTSELTREEKSFKSLFRKSKSKVKNVHEKEFRDKSSPPHRNKEIISPPPQHKPRHKRFGNPTDTYHPSLKSIQGFFEQGVSSSPGGSGIILALSPADEELLNAESSTSSTSSTPSSGESSPSSVRSALGSRSPSPEQPLSIQKRFYTIKIEEVDGEKIYKVIKTRKRGGELVSRYYREEKEIAVGAMGKILLLKSCDERKGKANVFKVALTNELVKSEPLDAEPEKKLSLQERMKRRLEASRPQVNEAKAKEELQRGIEILNDLMRNPNSGEPLESIPGIIPPYKAALEDGSGVLMKLFTGGSLANSKGELSRVAESFDDLQAFLPPLMFGLRHCHLLGYVVGDLKAQNVLIDELKSGKPAFYLSDLDGAKKMTAILSGKTEPSSTKHYRSLDDLHNQPTDPSEKEKYFLAGDTYAIGIFFREFVTGKGVKSFSSKTKEIAARILTPLKREDLNPNLQSNCPEKVLDQLVDLINAMTSMPGSDWRTRPSDGEIMDKLSEMGFAIPKY